MFFGTNNVIMIDKLSLTINYQQGLNSGVNLIRKKLLATLYIFFTQYLAEQKVSNFSESQTNLVYMRQIPSKSQTNLGHISDKYKVYPSHSIQAFEYISILILLFCLSISILFFLTGKNLEVTYFNFLFVLFNKSQAASNQCMSDIVGFYKNPICVCTVYRVHLYKLII